MHVKRVLIIVILFLLCLNFNVYSPKEISDTFVPAIMYHNIALEYPEATSNVNITPKLFEEHLKAMLSYGYTPISLSDYRSVILGCKKLPEKPILITFDDGYLSNYEIAYPLLVKYNIPATMFIVTSTVGLSDESCLVSYPHFSWEQAKMMQDSGLVEIFSHTHTHKDLAMLSESELERELGFSKSLIEKNLGTDCYALAYPYGGYSNETKNQLKSAGYDVHIKVNKTSDEEAYIANKASDRLCDIKRLTVRGDMSAEDLIKALNQL